MNEMRLSSIKEDPIDIELPICDSHHHLWNMPNRRYLLEELFQDIGGGHNIVQTIFVENESVVKKGILQPMEPVQETKYAHDLTTPNLCRQYGKTRVAAGIVGFADLTLGAAVKPILEAQIVASDRFRGIRQMANWDASPGIMSSGRPGLLSDKKFREGFACLKNYQLSFETFLFHPQLMELVDLARKFPDIPIILEHTGGPVRIGPYGGKDDEVFRRWSSGMAALANCPNVSVKLGGFGMPLYGFKWHESATLPGSMDIAEAAAPFILLCIEQFGVERCMFESNFPIDKNTFPYIILWNAFKLVTKGFSPDERKALFHDTAAKAYRLQFTGTPNL